MNVWSKKIAEDEGGFLTSSLSLSLCSGSAPLPVHYCIQGLKYLEKANFHGRLESQVGQDWQEAAIEQVLLQWPSLTSQLFPSLAVTPREFVVTLSSLHLSQKLPALFRHTSTNLAPQRMGFSNTEGWLVFLHSLGSWALPARSCPISAQWAQQDLMALSINRFECSGIWGKRRSGGCSSLCKISEGSTSNKHRMPFKAKHVHL